MAAAALLGSGALLFVLDYVARDSFDRTSSTLFLALALALAAAYAAAIDWNRFRAGWRLLPALLFLAAVAGGLFLTDLADTSHAIIGLSAAAVLTLTYVGFVFSPGTALFVSPLVIGVMLAANRLEPIRVSLALPLIGVPVAAGLGELVSALVDRSLRTQNRFSSRSERLDRLEDVLRRFRRPSSLQEAAEEVALAAIEIS